MLFTILRGRVPHALVKAMTADTQAMARLTGYLGALR